MSGLARRLVRWVTPPEPASDPEAQRVTRLLAPVLVFCGVFLVAYTPLATAVIPGPGRVLAFHGILLAAVALIALTLRRGHPRAAATATVAAVWAYVTLALAMYGGVRAPVLTSFLLVVLLAAMLFGLRAATLTAGLCLTSSLAVLGAEKLGLLPAVPPPTALRVWVVFASNLILLGGFAYLAAAEMRRANRTLREEIDERRNAEAQLRESETRARSFMDSSPMGIHLYRLEGERLVLTRANPAANRILGIDHGPLLGLEIEAAFPPLAATDVPEQYRRICSEGGVWNREQLRYEDGKVHGVFQVHAFQTDPGGMATLFLDVTEQHRQEEARRQLEEELRQSQKLEAVGRLAGGVAHDFNNLLMVITGHGELLRRRLEDGDPRLRKVQHIMSAADRASRLVRQLLAFSRSQALEPRVVDLNRLVTDAARMLRPVLGSDVSLTTDLAGDLGRVRVDPSQVEQVLMNLAVNARDAMPVGGTLSFETANRRVETPGPVPPGDYVVLTVRDTGAGMDAGTRSHVFEPFFTTKASGDGTGLGLAMAYGVVEQSRGHIVLESEPGRGTAFHIHLPRVEGEVQAAPPAGAGRATAGDETILVVEDEPSIRDLARELLEGLGYEVFEAETMEQALAAARNHTGRIDLTLADVVLPGVDVRDLVARLQSIHPEMRVLYMSGHGAATLSTHGIHEGRPDFLPKPFGQAQLARRVRQILDQTPSPPPPRGPSVNGARP